MAIRKNYACSTNLINGTGEMTQRLRALVFLPGYLGTTGLSKKNPKSGIGINAERSERQSSQPLVLTCIKILRTNRISCPYKSSD